MTEDIVI